MMLSEMMNQPNLYFLDKEATNLWRNNRTKIFRFGCSLVKNLNSLDLGSKGVVNFVKLFSPGFLNSNDKGVSLSTSWSKEGTFTRMTYFLHSRDEGGSIYPSCIGCLSSNFNSKFSIWCCGILGGSLPWILTLPYSMEWVVTRLYLKLSF